MSHPARTSRRSRLVTRLADAVRTHVAPGMHLHFASTPSRSNAAIREVARAFLDTRPGFRLSSTGFHSMAHLLPLLGLADRLTACFFGDHYPIPRPNALYTRLAAGGVVLEHWPLWSMVASLRAGAQGDDWVVNRSLRDTTMARELLARGDYCEIPVPAVGDSHDTDLAVPRHESAVRTIGLCAALRPDVTFVHAAAADDEGHVILSSPLSEGVWSALAARRGVIVTVERLVPVAVTRANPAAIALPPHRVLAICDEPFGAHPQPLNCAVELASPYRDDFEHYEHWRTITGDPAALAAFVDDVLRSPDAGEAYRERVGHARLAQLCEPEVAPAPVVAVEPATEPSPASAATGAVGPPPSAVDLVIIAGARQLAARARAIGARVLIAGIGQAFFAARIAQLQLAATGYTLRVMVETGLYDLDCSAGGHSYLLAYDNVVRARRLSAIDDILGVLACGADNRCIAALGAAQIDRHGNLNTTRLAGKLLVGSGGACDIAASVEEVVVMIRLAPGRLVDDVEYVTSPGHAVGSVVTDHGVLTRPAKDGALGGIRGDTRSELRARDRGSRGETWTIASLIASAPDQSIDHGVSALSRACPWTLVRADDLGFAAPIAAEEARLLDSLDPTGRCRQRAG